MSVATDDPPAVAEVRRLLARTEYLAAFDTADQALAAAPDDPALQHLAILALARAGATETASRRLLEARLHERVDELDVTLGEDVLALEARLAKDRALARPAADRSEPAADAARRYEQVFQRFGRTYTGINAATMWRLAGDRQRADALANDVLRLLDDPRSSPSGYWAAATRAEAMLLVGDVAGAAAALQVASSADVGADGVDLASRASTRRQLALVCELDDIDPTVIDALPVPVVLHYCGHLPGGQPGDAARLRGADERRVAREINALIARCGSVTAFGSLAAGGDILVAEAILAAGSELRVFLPFPVDDFEASSVAGAGEHWIERYRTCLDRASSMTIVTAARDGDDDASFGYCSSIAMGSAVIHAQHMASRAEQLAVWDGRPTLRHAGTSADIERWRATGLPATVVPVRPTAAIGATGATGVPEHVEQTVRALLFADLKDSSVLTDRQFPAFVEGVLEPLSRRLAMDSVVHRNGWGDALYVVFDDIGAAAEVALALQETMAGLDLEALGLPPLGLRIGMHAGPVFLLQDPVRDEPCYFGEHVTRAARIEPVAPTGAVYVTAAFAALLALDRPGEFVCEYVGQVPTAKNFGPLPMHLLRRRTPS